MTERCSVCQTANRLGSGFCNACGAPMATPLTCGDCGSAMPPGFRFCGRCGAPLSASAPPVSEVTLQPDLEEDGLEDELGAFEADVPADPSSLSPLPQRGEGNQDEPPAWLPSPLDRGGAGGEGTTRRLPDWILLPERVLPSWLFDPRLPEWLFEVDGPALPTALVDKPDPLDPHRPVDGLAHVVDR